jgi:hypothetical protein
MKTLHVWFASLVLLVGSAASQAATVTYSLLLDDNGPNTFTLLADVSLGDNGGLALFGVPLLGNITSLDHKSPNAQALLSGPPFFSPLGFSLFRSADNNPTVGGTQDTFNATSVLVYGLGQVGGNLATLPGVTSLVGLPEQPVFTAPLILAEGTYGSIAPSFNTASVDLLANVFRGVGSRQVIAADVQTVVVPEVGTLAMMSIVTIAGAFVAIRRRNG